MDTAFVMSQTNPRKCSFFINEKRDGRLFREVSLLKILLISNHRLDILLKFDTIGKNAITITAPFRTLLRIGIQIVANYAFAYNIHVEE